MALQQPTNLSQSPPLKQGANSAPAGYYLGRGGGVVSEEYWKMRVRG